MWRPELVERLIILSTPHPSGLFREIAHNSEQQSNSQYTRDFQKEDAHLDLTAEGLAGWVRDDEVKQIYIYIEAFRRSDFEAMLNYYKASFPRAGSNGTSQSHNSGTSRGKAPVRRVQCPTLAIFGLEDKALLPAGWNGTWDWIDRDLTLVAIPGAGHFVQHDTTELVTRTMKMWLNRSS